MPLQMYKFNGKELQTELDWNVEDYGVRAYDPVVARWWNVDPLANKFDAISSYNYTLDNPVRYIDPDGMGPGEGGSGVIEASQVLSYMYLNMLAARDNIGSTISGFINSNPASPTIIMNQTSVVADANGNVSLSTAPVVQTKVAALAFGMLDGMSLVPSPNPAGMLAKAPVQGEVARDIKTILQENKLNGKAAENFLNDTYGGAKQVYKPTEQGKRFIDNLTPEGTAQEAKVGRVPLSNKIKTQVNKDAEILNTPQNGVNNSEWHFFPSQIGTGPTPPLKDYLQQNNITPVIHE